MTAALFGPAVLAGMDHGSWHRIGERVPQQSLSVCINDENVLPTGVGTKRMGTAFADVHPIGIDQIMFSKWIGAREGAPGFCGHDVEVKSGRKLRA